MFALTSAPFFPCAAPSFIEASAVDLVSVAFNNQCQHQREVRYCKKVVACKSQKAAAASGFCASDGIAKSTATASDFCAGDGTAETTATCDAADSCAAYTAAVDVAIIAEASQGR